MYVSLHRFDTYNVFGWHWRLHKERIAELSIISTANHDLVFGMRPNDVIVLYRQVTESNTLALVLGGPCAVKILKDSTSVDFFSNRLGALRVSVLENSV
jgi:hypothetical protein